VEKMVPGTFLYGGYIRKNGAWHRFYGQGSVAGS